jgi:ubiquinone/menaquinone biosynthesis C-methylase UbiE
VSRDWQAWHRDYDDPSSSLSRRLVEVRSRLAGLLADLPSARPVRLLSLCAGDGRDTIPVLAECGRPVEACLVELDPELVSAARSAASAAGLSSALEVRAGDAGQLATFADRLPVDVLMLCGVFGNVADADVERTVAAARVMVTAGGAVVWTRGHRPPDDPAARVRRIFLSAGFDEVAFVAPDDATYRVGVARQTEPGDGPLPQRLFSFVR